MSKEQAETAPETTTVHVPGVWYRLADSWPPESETVWLCNPEKGFAGLGCLVWDGNEEAWFWAYSNGTIYAEDGKIVSECEFDDEHDYTHWSPLPALPIQATLEQQSRCCGRCDGVNDLCVADMVCDEHGEMGCETCYGSRE